MKSAALTLAAIALAWLAWIAGGEIAERLGVADLDPLPRVAALFAALALGEYLHKRHTNHQP